jgi:hypothetical protein
VFDEERKKQNKTKKKNIFSTRRAAIYLQTGRLGADGPPPPLLDSQMAIQLLCSLILSHMMMNKSSTVYTFI